MRAMTAAIRTRKSSSKARRKKRRATLQLGSNGAAPTLVMAQAEGVERLALAAAVVAGLAFAGFVPSGTRNPGESFQATPTRHPSQALKWNVRGSDATLLVTPDASLFGRARLARSWAERYRKPWLHLHPGNYDRDQLQQWLRTRPLKSLHVTGASVDQAERLATLLADLVQQVAEQASPGRVAAA